MTFQISKRYDEDGLSGNRSISIDLKGSAGQSFCAFLAKGVSVTLEGDANDYVGKVCISKGNTSFSVSLEAKSWSFLQRMPGSSLKRTRSLAMSLSTELLLVSAALKGISAGEGYFRGVAGERFAVRNSGATSVVEAVGDHGCEYMTGGRVIVLGTFGRNFAAAMSGGIAYIFNDE